MSIKMQSRRKNPVVVLGEVTERDGSIRKLVSETVSERDLENRYSRTFDNVYRVFPNMKYLPEGDHELDVLPCPHEARFAFVLKDGEIEAFDLSKFPGDGIVDVLKSSDGYRILSVSIMEGDHHGAL